MPPAGTDGLVVHAVAGLLLIGLGPFRIDREGERGAGAGDFRSRRGGRQLANARPKAAAKDMNFTVVSLFLVARQRSLMTGE